MPRRGGGVKATVSCDDRLSKLSGEEESPQVEDSELEGPGLRDTSPVIREAFRQLDQCGQEV